MTCYQRAFARNATYWAAMTLAPALVLAQAEPPLLEPTTVIANRIATELHKSGSAVTLMDGTQLREDQIHRLDDALRRSPGVYSESTGGQRGSVSSLFLRGTSTSQAHLRVDGIRLSDSTVASNNFLGTASLEALGRIEVLRGPQSALYGGESIGGVVSLSTLRGEGPPGNALFLEGGSFSSLRSQFTAQGELENGFRYAIGVGGETTENDAQGTPDLNHHQWSYAVRLEQSLSEGAQLGATLRGGHSRFDDAFGGENYTDYQLLTLYTDLEVTDHWESTLRFGYYTEAYDFDDPSTFATDAEKLSVSWENEVRLRPETHEHVTAFGILAEQTDYAQDFSFPADRDQLGLYATHLWQPNEALTVTGGLRWEDYDDYGDELTWRATAAYTYAPTDTGVRASFGTAFRAPNLIELNGGPFEAGNPSLNPERSEGWDLGLTQALGDTLTLSLTWFENEIENLIEDPFGASPFNTAGKGNANGLEAGLEGSLFNETLRLGLAYTYLDRSLAGLPEHVLESSARWEATERLQLGAGITYVGARDLGGDRLDDYLLLRLFASYQLNEHAALHVRVENATDQRYEHASFGGIPIAARRLGAFGGMTLRW